MLDNYNERSDAEMKEPPLSTRARNYLNSEAYHTPWDRSSLPAEKAAVSLLPALSAPLLMFHLAV